MRTQCARCVAVSFRNTTAALDATAAVNALPALDASALDVFALDASPPTSMRTIPPSANAACALCFTVCCACHPVVPIAHCDVG